ncbi:hypothetical protein GCM10023318_24610 [Nocardia callitridis]|uniref:Uncharacterized protein n=1 Tax=Nocardia callitridis TaxID=648753 RepID=A0ABP9KAC1_9NOCA
MQNTFGATRFVGDSPAGECVGSVAQQNAFGSVEQLLLCVVQVHPGWHWHPRFPRNDYVDIIAQWALAH